MRDLNLGVDKCSTDLNFYYKKWIVKIVKVVSFPHTAVGFFPT